jgi:hypothetical protein
MVPPFINESKPTTTTLVIAGKSIFQKNDNQFNQL